MDENSKTTNDFVIKDKRRFDDTGNLKADQQTGADQTESKTTETKVNKEQAFDQEYNLTFGSFIVSLATQALMQLGEIPAPEGVPVNKDFKAAKQTIDIIEMLAKKTVGNLETNEKQLLEEVLHTLRTAFIKHA